MLPSNGALQPVVVIVGTRPEGIKMIPVYQALQRIGVPVVLCSTTQHDELLSQVFDLFDVHPDFDLKIMRQGQDLFYLTHSILHKTKEVFKKINPSMVLVQGDTTSTMAAALSAFYLHIPVGHVEAGLRTDDIRAPFPEEMNRRVVGTVADFHFAPTAQAAAQVFAQGAARRQVFCTGNTVVDALYAIKEKVYSGQIVVNEEIASIVQKCGLENKKIILLTAHRRESFDGGIVRILESVKEYLQQHDNVFCFYPFHPNPHVVQAIERVGLSRLSNIFLSEPLAYKELAYLLLHANFVLTDSGGIQEEAVSLGKPVLVLREKTERPEGIWAGLATIVGTNREKIAHGLNDLLAWNSSEINQQLNVYGDGYASERIAQIVKDNIVVSSITAEEQPKSVSIIKTQEREVGMKKVAVLGLGYIGLPTSIVMAEAGLEVVGFDIDKKRIEAISAGDPVIQEPEIFEKLHLVLGAGTFRVSTDLEKADYFVIAVPTPFKENKNADLSYVFAAADSIAQVLSQGNVVLLESTVPVGATDQLASYLEEKTGLVAGVDFFVAHCPERVLPGKIFEELISNARIIGGINEESVQKARELYATFVEGDLYLSDAKTAEMVKLVENSSRDVQIAFAHQVASMAYSVGLDPYKVIELANKHPRVNILQPSCGVGGHCIAVDPWFLVETFPQDSLLLKTARQVNDAKPHEIIAYIKKIVAEWQSKNTKKCTVLTLGLTYKPNVDDLRESPALEIANILAKDSELELLVSEPHIKKEKLEQMFEHRVVSLQEGISRADVVVYLVGHKRFKAIDEKRLVGKKILDFCGIRHEMEKQEKDADYLFLPASSALRVGENDPSVEVKDENTMREESGR